MDRTRGPYWFGVDPIWHGTKTEVRGRGGRGAGGQGFVVRVVCSVGAGGVGVGDWCWCWCLVSRSWQPPTKQQAEPALGLGPAVMVISSPPTLHHTHPTPPTHHHPPTATHHLPPPSAAPLPELDEDEDVHPAGCGSHEPGHHHVAAQQQLLQVRLCAWACGWVGGWVGRGWVSGGADWAAGWMVGGGGEGGCGVRWLRGGGREVRTVQCADGMVRAGMRRFGYSECALAAHPPRHLPLTLRPLPAFTSYSSFN